MYLPLLPFKFNNFHLIILNSMFQSYLFLLVLVLVLPFHVKEINHLFSKRKMILIVK